MAAVAAEFAQLRSAQKLLGSAPPRGWNWNYSVSRLGMCVEPAGVGGTDFRIKKKKKKEFKMPLPKKSKQYGQKVVLNIVITPTMI